MARGDFLRSFSANAGEVKLLLAVSFEQKADNAIAHAADSIVENDMIHTISNILVFLHRSLKLFNSMLCFA